jgi:sulfatase modifying factor 1
MGGLEFSMTCFHRAILIVFVFLGGVAAADENNAPPKTPKAAAEAVATQPNKPDALAIKLVRVPPGEFTMGMPPNEKRDGNGVTQHRVKLTHGFMIGATEVTRAQFAAFVADTGYQTEAESDGKGGAGYVNGAWTQGIEFSWKNPGFAQAADHPAVDISWNDAKAFCAWLSRREGKTYRLPTEAEWEYACRAGTTTVYCSGDNLDDLKRVAWASYGATFFSAGGTARVATLAPNAWGLFDMHGNACEWCEDWYGDYPEGPAVFADPTGPANGKSHVLRGGGWSGNLRTLTAAYRRRNETTRQENAVGFRVVRVEVDPAGGK